MPRTEKMINPVKSTSSLWLRDTRPTPLPVAQRRERLYFVGFRDDLPAAVVGGFAWPSWADAADADVAELQVGRETKETACR